MRKITSVIACLVMTVLLEGVFYYNNAPSYVDTMPTIFAKESEIVNMQGLSVTTPSATKVRAVQVDDLVTVKDLIYRVVDNNASKRTVKIVGYSEDAEKVQLVSKVTIDGKSYKVIGISSYAFYGCEELTGKVNIGTYVTSIGDYAFYGCINMTSVTFGKQIKNIGKMAFYKGTNLKKLDFSKATKLTKVGTRAFSEVNKKVVCSYANEKVKKLVKKQKS